MGKLPRRASAKLKTNKAEDEGQGQKTLQARKDKEQTKFRKRREPTRGSNRQKRSTKQSGQSLDKKGARI